MTKLVPLRPHYDQAIIGRTAATTLLACLLAKTGQRVLLLDHAPQSPEPGLPYCPLAGDLLQQLNIPLHPSSALPLQVITDDVRWTLSAKEDLRQEVTRECPEEAGALLELLEQWTEWGQHLLRLLQQLQPPLGSIGARLAFHWAVLQNLPYRTLSSSVRRFLHQRFTPQTQRTLETLAMGLTGIDASVLSVAEAALAWHTRINADQLCPDRLQAELDQRFHQFHGQTTALETVARFQPSNGSWKILRQEGNPIRIDSLLLAAPDQQHRFEGLQIPALKSATATVSLPIQQPTSPVLADCITLAAPGPCILHRAQTPLNAYLELGGAAGRSEALPVIHEQLQRLFPFSPPQVEGPLPETAHLARRSHLLTTSGRSLALTNGLLLAHAGSLFPHLPSLAPLLTVKVLLNHLLKTS